MVADVRYAVPPRGYIFSVDALLRIAAARHPDRWRPELLHQKEAEIYSGLGRKYKADFLELELRTQIPQAEIEGNRAIAERFFDFNDAVYDLRGALHAGDLIAEYCDERGEFGSIKSAGWGGGDEGLLALLGGTVKLEDGWVRLVLFKIDSIDKFAAGIQPETAGGSPRRRAGHGSFEALDEPLLIEMKDLLKNLKAASAEEAARMVADRAHGAGAPESKAERLARRYRKREK
jgi:hypothetical protein